MATGKLIKTLVILSILMCCGGLAHLYAQEPRLSVSSSGILSFGKKAVLKIDSKEENIPAGEGYISAGLMSVINLNIKSSNYSLIDCWRSLAENHRSGAFWVPLIDIEATKEIRIVVYGYGITNKENLRKISNSQFDIKLSIPLDRCDVIRFVVIDGSGRFPTKHIYGYDPCSKKLYFIDRWLTI